MTLADLEALMPTNPSMWPGFYFSGGVPWEPRPRAHKPPDWPHDRPCWCGKRKHTKQLSPGTKRRGWWRRG